METIRLKVKVLPWQNAASTPQSELSRQHDIKTWIEPCSADLTVSTLHEKILDSFADLHGGKGDLNIKWLEDDDGNVLRGHLRVGDTFRESRDISDRTVKVVRLPPSERDLISPGRFSSIAPDSSARPYKHALGFATQAGRNSLRDLINTEDWSIKGASDTQGRAAKRQKIDDIRSRRERDYDQPILSSEDVEEHRHDASNQTCRQESPVHQVDDSQRSKPRNPYGTPTSISVYSPLNAISSTQNGIIAIPDSPERGTGAYQDISGISGCFRAKSESPELTASILEFPSTASTGAHDLTREAVPLDDPIVPTSSDTSIHRNATNATFEQISALTPPMKLQEHIMPSHATRRSPFLINPSTQGVRGSRQDAYRHFQKQSSLTRDAVEVREGSMPTHAGSLLPQSPVKVATSAVALSPSQSKNSESGDAYRDSSNPGMQEDLSVNLDILTERQSPKSCTAVDIPCSTLSTADAKECRKSLGSSNHGHADHPPIADATATTHAIGSRSDKVQSADAPSLIIPRQVSSHGTEQAAISLLKSTQQGFASSDANVPEPQEKVVNSPLTRHTDTSKRRQVESIQDPVVGRGKSEIEAKPQDRIAVPEIVNIEETEDESRTARSLRGNQEEVGKHDIWSVPSDTDQEAVARIHRNTARSPHQRSMRKDAISRANKLSDRKHLHRDSTEVTRLPSIGAPSGPAQQEISEVKKDKADNKRRGKTVERRRGEVEGAKSPTADSPTVLSELSSGGGGKVSILRQTAKAKNVTEEPNSVHVSEQQKTTNASLLNANRLGRNTNSRRETSQGTALIEENLKNKEDARKRRVGNIDTLQGRKVKRTKVQKAEEVQPPREAEKDTQMAAMAAREAEAIAQMQRSVMSSSTKSATKKTNKMATNTGVESVDSARESRHTPKAHNAKSSTPGTDNASSKRRSMTPLFPSSTTLRPVKSALRSSESLSRRSVSFSDAIACKTPTPVDAKNAKPMKSSASRSAEATSTSFDYRDEGVRSSPSDRASKKRVSVVSTNSNVVRPSLSKSTATNDETVRKPKIQTKLNVTRDVKLKGRVIEAPPPLASNVSAKDDEIMISSDSERSASTFFSDEEAELRPAKAGPSSNKKLGSTVKSENGSVARRMTPVGNAATDGPRLSSGDSARRKAESPNTTITKEVALDPDLRKISRSRSPAQYMSKADTENSQSRSSTDSRTFSKSEPGSASESDEEGSETESGSEDGSQASSYSNSAWESKKKGAEVQTNKFRGPEVEKKGLGHWKVSTSAYQKSSSPETPSPKPAKTETAEEDDEEEEEEEEEEDLALKMEQQLQKDCRQSMDTQLVPEPTLPSKKRTSTKVDSPAAELPKIRFPTFSGLQKRGTNDSTKSRMTQLPGSTLLSHCNGKVESLLPSSGKVHRNSTESDSEDASSSSGGSDDNISAQQPERGWDRKAAKQPYNIAKEIGRIVKISQKQRG